MQAVAELFVRDEGQLGFYQAELARLTDSGWSPTIPPLYVTITNFRLILVPQTRRPYPPASIPSNYITRVWHIGDQHRDGIALSLRTGHELYMFTDWHQGVGLERDLKTMLITPISHRFSHTLAQRDISRIIRFVERI